MFFLNQPFKHFPNFLAYCIRFRLISKEIYTKPQSYLSKYRHSRTVWITIWDATCDLEMGKDIELY